jgi:hypothetical protein
MALAQLGIVTDQRELALRLGTRPGVGTPFSRIRQLQNVNVQLTEWGGLAKVADALLAGTAVIAAVITTPGLTGWHQIRTQHTVLISAVNPTMVVYHDPTLTYGPVTASRDEFSLAWSEMAEKAAFISQG